MTMSSMTPTIGAQIYTADGDKLGKVKEVSVACFKVDAAMQPDYRLANDTIADAAGGNVRLSFTQEGLGDMKLDGPDVEKRLEHSGVHRHRDTDTVL